MDSDAAAGAAARSIAIAYAAAIAIAAGLSAFFTYLYGRRAGLTRAGAVAAGGTFACAGFFASRVMAGHLPLLEAYPALPLLLWLVDRTLAPERAQRRKFDLGALAFATACVVVAGHPQLPAYAVASALLYTFWKRRGAIELRVAGAIALGAGATLAVWWPMLLLIARSTRVLPLAPPDNDVAMPYARLGALVIPGIHGWPQPMDLADTHRFSGFPNAAYFWDTASYAGILPLAAIVALLIGCIVRKRMHDRKHMPDARWTFLACLGVAAFVGSLPLASPLLHLLPGTLLRSPARLLYLSTFGAAMALGAGVDAFRRARWPRGDLVKYGLLVLVLSAHFGDLWRFAHAFILVEAREEETPEFQAIIDREGGDARIAEERAYPIVSNNDRHDDAGGFDSIFLAPFYRGLLALAGAPRDLNRQWIDASALPVRALEATGVRFVITSKTRTDLALAASDEEVHLYRVANPAPRAAFFSATGAEFLAATQIPESFAKEPHDRLLLALDARQYLPAGGQPATNDRATIVYSRPTSDEILLGTISEEAGFAQVLESWDPGWKATVDGASAPVLTANGFTLAVPVTAGDHTVRLRYETPGRGVGAGLSLLSLASLVLLIVTGHPRT